MRTSSSRSSNQRLLAFCFLRNWPKIIRCNVLAYGRREMKNKGQPGVRMQWQVNILLLGNQIGCFRINRELKTKILNTQNNFIFGERQLLIWAHSQPESGAGNLALENI